MNNSNGRLGRFLLALALLVAQHTALAHQYWHAAAAAHAPSEHTAPAKGSLLCDLHDLLGNVLGAVHAGTPHAALLAFSEVGFCAAPILAADKRTLAPHSRGPPAVS